MCAAARVKALNPHCVSAKGNCITIRRNCIETTAENLAVQGLAVGLPPALQPARTDGNIGAIGDGRKQAAGLIHRRRKIGIRKHDNVALCIQDSGPYTIAFAAISGVFKQPDLGGPSAKSRTSCAVESVEPSLTTMTSAGHWLARIAATTDSSVAGIRALSLNAGMTILYLGYSANVLLLPFSMTRQRGKTQDIIPPRGRCGAGAGKEIAR